MEEDAVEPATPTVDPTWWERAEMRQALADHDVRAVFSQLQRCGWSQTAIGAAVGLSQGEVSQIKAGSRQVASYAVLARISTSFSIPPGHMGLAWSGQQATPRTLDTEEDDPAYRRELLGVTAALAVGASVPDLDRWLPNSVTSQAPLPARVGRTDVEQLRSLTHELWEVDQQRGGGAALDAAFGALTTASSLLKSSQVSDQTAEELQGALADLHSLVGWSLHDLGRHRRATKHFTAALSLGSATDDRSMVAAALYRLGRVSVHTEQPGEALRAFQLGTMAAQDAGSYADLARLHVSSAWAYALMGQSERMYDSFARAEHELGRIDASSSPPWASAFVRSGDWDGVRAMSYIILARQPGSDAISFAEKAAEVAERIVTSPADGRPERSRVFDQIIYAAGRLSIGDRENGVAAAHSVIDRVEQLHSIRAVDRLADIDRAAAAQPDDETNEIRQRISRLRLV
ncbi:MAG TPA: hypothetical protein VHX38_00620 [Pseudonocardiaceae bacterium]|jgi:tetratricopeptide (TPR) repeat protein|nr:hypothetical protein [Pseudonocardiaceae bacterium]